MIDSVEILMEFVAVLISAIICFSYGYALYLVTIRFLEWAPNTFTFFLSLISFECFKNQGHGLAAHVMAHQKCPWMMSYLSDSFKDRFWAIRDGVTYQEKLFRAILWLYHEPALLIISIILVIITCIAVPVAFGVVGRTAYNLYIRIRHAITTYFK